MKPSDIAIVVFTYGRLDHTKVTLDYLSSNKWFEEHPTIIFSDGPKLGHEEKVQVVREFLKNFREKNKNVEIVLREKNIGLEKSIITGISETLKKYPAVIAIEDDIRTSSTFLGYMRHMLNLYRDDKKVGSISGYSHKRGVMNSIQSYKYDIFFVPRTSSWGWATWRDRWDDVDWEISEIETFIKDKETQKEFNKGGKDLSSMLIKQVVKGIDTWDIQWCYHNFKRGRLTVYPTISYVENIGHDGTGIHCGISSEFKNEFLNTKEVKTIPESPFVDARICNEYKKVFEMTPMKFLKLGFNKVIQETKKIFNI